MQSRRDHVQAYQFATNRLMSALVSGNPGRGMTPFRRAAIGTIAGIIVAVLLTGGSVIYGLIDPASAATKWQQPGAVVVDEQTGTRFVYLNGELHPTANTASAVLASTSGSTGSSGTVSDVPHSALASVPVGTEIGIPGAPEIMPTAMLPGTWAVCLAAGGQVMLDLDPAAHATGATSDDLILVADSAGSQYVLFDSTKYPVGGQSALVAFGLGTQQPLSVPKAWLAELPTGPALAVPAIPGIGQPGPTVSGHSVPVGTVFDAPADGVNQYYVVLRDGMAPVSRTAAALLAASGRVGSIRHVSPAVIATTPASSDRALLSGLPDLFTGTAYQPGSAALCIRQTAPGKTPGKVITDPGVTAESGVAGVAGVVMPGSAGMLVEPPAKKSTDSPPVYLVTGGERFQLADDDAAGALGYGTVTPVVMPAAILSIIPAGPALSAAAARQPVTQQPASQQPASQS